MTIFKKNEKKHNIDLSVSLSCYNKTFTCGQFTL